MGDVQLPLRLCTTYIYDPTSRYDTPRKPPRKPQTPSIKMEDSLPPSTTLTPSRNSADSLPSFRKPRYKIFNLLIISSSRKDHGTHRDRRKLAIKPHWPFVRVVSIKGSESGSTLDRKDSFNDSNSSSSRELGEISITEACYENFTEFHSSFEDSVPMESISPSYMLGKNLEKGEDSIVEKSHERSESFESHHEHFNGTLAVALRGRLEMEYDDSTNDEGDSSKMGMEPTCVSFKLPPRLSISNLFGHLGSHSRNWETLVLFTPHWLLGTLPTNRKGIKVLLGMKEEMMSLKMKKDDESGGEEQAELWKKRILMGRRCQPSEFLDDIYVDERKKLGEVMIEAVPPAGSLVKDVAELPSDIDQEEDDKKIREEADISLVKDVAELPSEDIDQEEDDEKIREEADSRVDPSSRS